MNYALSTVLFVIPLALHEGAADTGLTLLPMTVLVALNPLLTSRLVARRGPLLPIRLGLLAFTIGLCASGVAMAGERHPVTLGVALIACGLGVSWTLPPLVGHILGRSSSDDAGSVGGILNATRQVGATLGAATASAALAAHPDGVRVATPLVGAAVLCALGLAGSMMTGRRADA